MAQKSQKLGRGLDSLITSLGARVGTVPPGAPQTTDEGGLKDLLLSSIQTNPKQPRKEFDEAALNELVESLRRHGLLQPIVVRSDGQGYQIVAGERRWRAAQELGWERIKAVIVDVEDRKLLEVALIENIQREDLGPIELAQAFRALVEEHGLTQEELAQRLGKSRSGIANTMRLLELPDAVKDRVSRGTVSMGAARAILALGSEERMDEIAGEVAEGRLTVRQVEALAGSDKKAGTRTKRTVDPNLLEMAAELQRQLGTKVKISGSLKKGRLEIEYFSAPQLEQIRHRLSASRGSELAVEAEENGFTI